MTEGKILAEFPEIQRKFQVPLTRKIMRTTSYNYLFYAGIAALPTVVPLVLIRFVWNFCDRMRKSGKQSLERVRQDIQKEGEGMAMDFLESTLFPVKLLRKLFSKEKGNKRSYHPYNVAHATNQNGDGDEGICLLELKQLRVIKFTRTNFDDKI